MEKKDFAIIKGILLHPFKMLCFKLNKEREHYNIILSNRARYRKEDKQRERALFMSSITKTPFIF